MEYLDNLLSSPSTGTQPLLEPAEARTAPPARQSDTTNQTIDLDNLLSGPRPEQPANLDDLLTPSPITVDVSSPSSKIPEVMRQERAALAANKSTVTPITPYGTVHNVQYPEEEISGSLSPMDTLAQMGFGVIKATTGLGASVEKGIYNLTGDDQYRQKAAISEDVGRQFEKLGQTTGGIPGARAVGEAIGSVPEMVAVGQYGLPAQVAYFALKSASNRYYDAKEAGYQNPGLVAIADGLINGVVMAVPGATGLGAASKIKDLIAAPTFKHLAETLVEKFGDDTIKKHVAVGALQMGVLSGLESALDKMSTEPNLTLEEALKRTASGAVTGGFLSGMVAGGFKLYGRSVRDYVVSNNLKDWERYISSDESLPSGGEAVDQAGVVGQQRIAVEPNQYPGVTQIRGSLRVRGEAKPESVFQPEPVKPVEKPEYAPVEYVGYQPGITLPSGKEFPGFHMVNVTQDIPGFIKGSTVASKSLESAGYKIPAGVIPEAKPEIKPTSETEKVASATASEVKAEPKLEHDIIGTQEGMRQWLHRDDLTAEQKVAELQKQLSNIKERKAGLDKTIIPQNSPELPKSITEPKAELQKPIKLEQPEPVKPAPPSVPKDTTNVIRLPVGDSEGTVLTIKNNQLYQEGKEKRGFIAELKDRTVGITPENSDLKNVVIDLLGKQKYWKINEKSDAPFLTKMRRATTEERQSDTEDMLAQAWKALNTKKITTSKPLKDALNAVKDNLSFDNVVRIIGREKAGSPDSIAKALSEKIIKKKKKLAEKQPEVFGPNTQEAWNRAVAVLTEEGMPKEMEGQKEINVKQSTQEAAIKTEEARTEVEKSLQNRKTEVSSSLMERFGKLEEKNPKLFDQVQEVSREVATAGDSPDLLPTVKALQSHGFTEDEAYDLIQSDLEDKTWEHAGKKLSADRGTGEGAWAENTPGRDSGSGKGGLFPEDQVFISSAEKVLQDVSRLNLTLSKDGTPSPKEAKQILAQYRLDSGSIDQVLQSVVSQSPDTSNQRLAKLLLASPLVATTNMRLVTDAEMRKYGATKGKPEGGLGVYDPASHSILINEKAITSPSDLEYVLLHEAVHAGTIKATKENPEAKARVDQLLEEARKQLGYVANGDLSNGGVDDSRENGYYGLKNAHEFMAEVFGDRQFQAALDMVKTPKSSEGGEVGKGTTTSGGVAQKAISVWKKIVNWVSELFGFRKGTVKEDITDLVENILKQPIKVEPTKDNINASPQVDWMIDMKNKAAYDRQTVLADELPKEEQDFIKRGAYAQNSWLNEADIASKLAVLSPEAKRTIKNITGSSQELLGYLNGEGHLDPSLRQSYAELQADPKLSLDRKKEVTLAALNRLDKFEYDVSRFSAVLDKKILDNRQRLSELPGEIDELEADRGLLESSRKELVEDFTDRTLREIKDAKDEQRVEELNARLKLVNQFKQSTGLSYVLKAMADKLPLHLLVDSDLTSRQILDNYRAAFPSEREAAEYAHVDPKMLKVASLMMSEYNNLREDLLTAKLSKDEKIQAAIHEMDFEAQKYIKEEKWDKALAQYTKKVGKIVAEEDKAKLVLSKLRSKQTRTLRKLVALAEADKALKEVKDSDSFKTFSNQVYRDAGVLKHVVYNQGQSQKVFIDPLNGDAVPIDMTFNKDVEDRNLLKLKNLFDNVDRYLADPNSPRYDERVAAVWRNLLPFKGYYLDPAVRPEAGKLVEMKLNPLKLIDYLGSGLNISDFELMMIGGRPARDAQLDFQAYSAAKAQMSEVKRKYTSRIALANYAAKEAHGMTVEQWNNEILQPIYASRQTTGNIPYGIEGNLMVNGHKILPSDIAAMNVQIEFEHAVRDIAEKAHGFTATAIEPARINYANKTAKIESTGGKATPEGGLDSKGMKNTVVTTSQEYQRKALPTGPTTTARRFKQEVRQWLSQWKEAGRNVGTIEKFINDNFEDIMVGHMRSVGSPDYHIQTPFTKGYRVVLKTIDAGVPEAPANVDEVVDSLFQRQDRAFAEGEMKGEPLSKFDIKNRIFDEARAIFDKIEKYRSSELSTDVSPILSVVDSDNSFTQPRGELIAPVSFYEYGATFDRQQVGLLHSAQSFYAVKLAGKNGSLQKLLTAVESTVNQYDKQLESEIGGKEGVSKFIATKKFQKGTEANMAKGETLLSYAQAVEARRKVSNLVNEVNRIFSKKAAASDPDAIQLLNILSGFVVSNLLISPTSQITNTMGGVGNMILFDKLIGRSAAKSTTINTGRLIREGAKEVAHLATTSENNPVAKKLYDIITSPVFGEMADAIGGVLDGKKEELEKLQEFGLTQSAPVWQDIQAYRKLFTEGGTAKEGEATLGQLGLRSAESTLGAFSAVTSAVAPRIMDRTINFMSTSGADSLLENLRMKALTFIPKRLELAKGKWDAEDITNLRNKLTPEELLGSGSKDKDAAILRGVFSRVGLNLDEVLYRYNRAIEEAKSKGEDINNVPFVSDEERRSIQWSVAQDVNLPTFATRPLGSKGSQGRGLIGTFYGFPIWQNTRYRILLSRYSKDKSMLPHVGAAVAVALSLAFLGAGRLSINKWVTKTLYNEESSLPDILHARSPQDSARILAFGASAFVPFAGSLIANWLNQTPNRYGFDINSQFVMLNAANDIWNTIGPNGKVWTTHDIVHPTLEFTRRWFPLSRAVLNRIEPQEGLTDYYNVSRVLRQISPEDLEKKRGMAGVSNGVFGTPMTPLLQDMVNAAFRDDRSQFQEAFKKAVKEKMELSNLDKDAAEKAVAQAFSSKNSFQQEFGKEITEGDYNRILANASSEQKDMIHKMERTFEKYVDLMDVPGVEPRGVMFEEGPGNRHPGEANGSNSGSGGGRSAVTSGGQLREPSVMGSLSGKYSSGIPEPNIPGILGSNTGGAGGANGGVARSGVTGRGVRKLRGGGVRGSLRRGAVRQAKGSMTGKLGGGSGGAKLSTPTSLKKPSVPKPHQPGLAGSLRRPKPPSMR